MFAVPQTIAGKKVSALQAVSIHVEYNRGNCTYMVYQFCHLSAVGYFVNGTSKVKVVIC